MLRILLDDDIEKCPVYHFPKVIDNNIVKYIRHKSTLKAYNQKLLDRIIKEKDKITKKKNKKLLEQYDYINKLIEELDQKQSVIKYSVNCLKLDHELIYGVLTTIFNNQPKTANSTIQYLISLFQEREYLILLIQTEKSYVARFLESLNPEINILFACLTFFDEKTIIYKILYKQLEDYKSLLAKIE